MLRQLSVFIENNQGSLADLTQALERRGIIIHTLALAAIQEAGYSGCLTEVVGVKAPDEGAGLTNALKALSENAIDIEYLYMLKTREGMRTLVFGVGDTARSESILTAAGYALAQDSELG